MQWIAVVSGLVELGLSFVLGILVAYLSFRVLARMTRDVDEVAELKRDNTAVGVLLASMLVGSALIVRQALFPAVSSLKTALFHGLGLAALAKLAALYALYFVVVLALAVVGIGLAVRVFVRLTRDLDEMAEIRANNVAVALTVGAVIVVLALFLSQGVASLLSALVPYPALGSIEIMGGP